MCLERFVLFVCLERFVFSFIPSVLCTSETQKQALELLQCVMTDDRGVEAVTDDQRIVTYVMACLLTSKCRFILLLSFIFVVFLYSSEFCLAQICEL